MFSIATRGIEQTIGLMFLDLSAAMSWLLPKRIIVRNQFDRHPSATSPYGDSVRTIVILHRIPFDRIRYEKAIDHGSNRVVYVGQFQNEANHPHPALKITADLSSLNPHNLPADVHDVLLHCDLLIARGERDLLLAARLREIYNIPGDTVIDVLPIRDKLLMRQFARNHSILQPEFWPLTKFRDVSMEHSQMSTVVLKPRLDAASNGVVVGSAMEIMEMSQNLDAKDWIIESFVDGDIYHLDGFLEDGELRAFQASKYINTCLSFASGIPLGSVQVANAAWMFEAATKIAAALRYRNGSFHLEMILTEKGEPHFLEFAGRVAGAYIAEAFEQKTGINLYQRDLTKLLGRRTDWTHYKPKTGMYGWFLYPYGSRTNSRRVEALFKKSLVLLNANANPIKPEVPSYLDIHSPLCGIVVGDPSCEDILMQIISVASEPEDLRSGRLIRSNISMN